MRPMTRIIRTKSGAHRVARTWTKLVGLLLLAMFLGGVAVQLGVRP